MSFFGQLRLKSRLSCRRAQKLASDIFTSAWVIHIIRTSTLHVNRTLHLPVRSCELYWRNYRTQKKKKKRIDFSSLFAFQPSFSDILSGEDLSRASRLTRSFCQEKLLGSHVKVGVPLMTIENLITYFRVLKSKKKLLDLTKFQCLCWN